MLWDFFAERTKSRTAATIKPRLSHSPPGVYLYSVLLKISDLSFVDIAYQKENLLFDQRRAGNGRGGVQRPGGSLLISMVDPSLLRKSGLLHPEIMGSIMPRHLISEIQTCKGGFMRLRLGENPRPPT